MANKQCTKCKTVYDDIESNFHPSGKSYGCGFRSECKICRCKYSREHSQLPEVKARKKETNAIFYPLYYSRPEIKLMKKKNKRKYQATPKGRGKKRASDAKRRATKRNQTPDYANFKLIEMIYEYRPEGYEVDHIKSLSRGGLHYESNLCYLPEAVNRSKKDKTIEEFGVDKFNKHVVYWQNIL